MHRKFVTLGAAAIVLSVVTSACGGTLTPAATGPSAVAPEVFVAKGAALSVTPPKLSFTTSKTLVMKIDEAGYRGAFKIVNSAPKVVKAPASAKGPAASVKVESLAAGSATITVSDSKGNEKKIPVSVTTGVVVVQ